MKLREQLNQMQTMMEQLVKMVGHNNAVTEELVQRMDRLEVKVDNLEIKVDKLEAKVSSLEIKVDKLEAKVDSLETKLNNLEIRVTSLETESEKGFTDIIQMINVPGEKADTFNTTQALHAEMIRTLAADTAQHEAEITLLKRAKAS